MTREQKKLTIGLSSTGIGLIVTNIGSRMSEKTTKGASVVLLGGIGITLVGFITIMSYTFNKSEDSE